MGGVESLRQGQAGRLLLLLLLSPPPSPPPPLSPPSPPLLYHCYFLSSLSTAPPRLPPSTHTYLNFSSGNSFLPLSLSSHPSSSFPSSSLYIGKSLSLSQRNLLAPGVGSFLLTHPTCICCFCVLDGGSGGMCVCVSRTLSIGVAVVCREKVGLMPSQSI